MHPKSYKMLQISDIRARKNSPEPSKPDHGTGKGIAKVNGNGIFQSYRYIFGLVCNYHYLYPDIL